ncbi:MAG: hypothetical protein J0L84_03525, partial [Verrucomicrobia bacterium]|nr:hypothetical protein [Verrucomicrobiota bacterium]
NPVLPPNDDPSTPLVIEGATAVVTGSTRLAEAEPGVLGGVLLRTVWYEWTAPLTGKVHLSIEGRGFQPIVYLGEGRYPGFTAVNPLGNTAAQPVLANVTAGVTYTLLVAGAAFDGGEGDFDLRLEAAPLPPPPPNDAFALRAPVDAAGTLAVASLESATLEAGEPDRIVQGVFANVRGSLWWDYQAVQAGFLVLDTDPHADITVFRGDRLESLTPLDLVPWERPVIVPVAAGDRLPFAVHGLRLQTNQYTLRATYHPPAPANDRFGDRLRLDGAAPEVRGFFRGATREAGEPVHGLPGSTDVLTGESAWWSWAAPATGRAVVQLVRDDAARVAVYQGPVVDRLARVAGSRSPGHMVFTALAGQVYHIAVERLQGGTGFAEFSIGFEPFAPAPNDRFADAIRWTPADAASRLAVTEATREPGEPEHRSGGGKSLWWRFVMPLHGELELRNDEGTVRDAVLSVYTGTRVEALTRRASGRDYVRFRAVGGTEYFIAIEAEPGAVGDVQLLVNPLWSERRVVAVPGNLVANPSFEELRDGSPDLHWTIEPGYLGYVGTPPPGAADGGNCIAVNAGATVRQTVPTVAGRRYRIRFAARGDAGAGEALVRVMLGAVEGGEATFATGFPQDYWHWWVRDVTAVADGAELRLECAGATVALDAVSVVWLNEPPAIVTPPRAAFAYVGGGASWVVGATGSDPLSYQWLHDDQAIPGEQGHVLVVDPVTAAAGGAYRVAVSNAFGVAWSDPVPLTTGVASSPQIVRQPQGDAVVTGQYFALSVTAVGPEPLRYQWLRNGEPVPGATGRVLEFPAVSPADLGEYSVQVWSFTESSTSLPAFLTPAAETPAGEGTSFEFAAWIPGSVPPVDVEVFDVDGETPLHGPGFAAQLYAGPSVDRLRPVGEPQPFLDAFLEGRWRPARVLLPQVATDGSFLVQVRAWDRSRAASYEEARALGLRFGRSPLLERELSDPPLGSEVVLAGLPSFSLQLGLPEFTVGRIVVRQTDEGGALVLEVTGAPGFRYLLEHRVDGAHWRPLHVFENFTGQGALTVPLGAGTAVLYRARILD